MDENERKYPSWEQVDDENTQRLKVPGGWLYSRAVTAGVEDAIIGVTMVFVPEQKKAKQR